MLLRQRPLLQVSALALDKEGRKPPYRSIRYTKSTKTAIRTPCQHIRTIHNNTHTNIASHQQK